MRENGKHLDKYRKEHPAMGSSPGGALFGYFRIKRDDCMLDVISSGESHGEGIEAWEHVSVSVSRRRQTPTWSQMCQIKNLFWGPDETVIQFHPPESDYVSFHDFCLHLWKPPYSLALPDQLTLGPVTNQDDRASVDRVVTCRWDGGWAGKCKSPAIDNIGFCDKHKGQKCASCGKEAVRECDHTGIQFVCGAPLCATCQHGIPERGKEGMFLLGGGHVTAEVYQEQFGKTFR